jgi:ubiquinone/menaquinone biosynthesis C-methylase UbiE
MMYTCPDCRTALVQLKCPSCQRQFAERGGFPVFLSTQESLKEAPEIVGSYDRIYSVHEDVWEDQGRTPEFIRFFAGRLNAGKPRRTLEVGCGEGFLLAATAADEKFATDLSVEALAKAKQKSPQANLSVALAERLPFPDDSFDAVSSVGVMEHFLDDKAATREILRVLRPGGTYTALIHVARSVPQKIRQKIDEFVVPPRPIRFLRWLFGKKLMNRITQPVQRGYTRHSAKAILEAAGFRVKEVLHRGEDPKLPLVGPHVVIYVAEK